MPTDLNTFLLSCFYNWCKSCADKGPKTQQKPWELFDYDSKSLSSNFTKQLGDW